MDSEYYDDDTMPICAKCSSELTMGVTAYSCDNKECCLFLVMQKNPPLGEPNKLFSNCIRQLDSAYQSRFLPKIWKLTTYDITFLRGKKIAPE